VPRVMVPGAMLAAALANARSAVVHGDQDSVAVLSRARPFLFGDGGDEEEFGRRPNVTPHRETVTLQSSVLGGGDSASPCNYLEG
jgi:hypothetical protein